MSSGGIPPARSSSPARLLAFVWVGMAVFGILNIPLLSVLPSRDSGLIGAGLFAAIIIGLAAVAFFMLRWRAFAAGLLAGYVVMTLVSQGVCTLFASGSAANAEEGYIGGLFLYVLGMFIFGIIVAVVGAIGAIRSK
jgi:hypothetical protein